MGRGISLEQKKILGLATFFASVHELPIGRGDECSDDWNLAPAKVMKNHKHVDIKHPHCVHYIWKIAISKTIEHPGSFSKSIYRNPIRRTAYTQGNPGCFDMKQPGVNAAKVAASKALKRLCNRDLLRYGVNEYGYIDGYVLTTDGIEIGKQYQPDDVSGEIVRDHYFGKDWQRKLRLT